MKPERVGEPDVDGGLAGYPLLDAMPGRRSRRFGMGMKILDPFAYDSRHDPLPLTEASEAAMDFGDYKCSREEGTLRDGGTSTRWKDGADVQAGIPTYSDAAIAATIAYCDHVYNRYGRFPANSDPSRTLLAHQAHRLVEDFYERFYKPEVVPSAQEGYRWGSDQTRGGVE